MECQSTKHYDSKESVSKFFEGLKMAMRLPWWLNNKQQASRFRSKNRLKFVSRTREQFWLPSTWPKSCQCFQRDSSLPKQRRPLSRFYNIGRAFSLLKLLFWVFPSKIQKCVKHCGTQWFSLNTRPRRGWIYWGVLVSYITLSFSLTALPWIFKVKWTFTFYGRTVQ